ncbi:MAG: hypothetical protein JNK84_21330 [Phreatobacter sp.]|uniref:hypothetical protein n=1 Tax=Phreatobacter sp. TaxID=1966341 RepID=UPI001A5CDE3D|nr:hypothetical protein [Phreatobacter sp.]MBL8571626.1 hypothetical protein [Phreatobacter sp.]
MNGVDIGIRLVGAFYIVAGIVAARQMVLDAFMDKALASITLKPVPRADRLRGRWMLGTAVAVFSGGVLLVVLSILALPAFLVAAALQAAYLGYAAPRLIDPDEEPDPDGRRATINAFLIYLVATALVVAVASAGLLRSPLDEPWPLAGAAIAVAAFAAYHLRRVAAVPAGAVMPTSSDPSAADEAAVLPRKVRLMIRPFVLPFADDATGWVVPQTLAAETFGEELVGDILDWETNYLGTIPQGKRKGGFTDPQQAEHHEAEGRALAARMAEAIGADRIAYAPVGTVFPEAPERVYTNPRRIKLMADYGCHPVWSLDDEYGSNIDPEALGLSPALATDLNAWVGRFEDALDWDNPGAFREDDGFLARHEAEGRKLAIRVARELRDQGRGGIMVFLMTREFGVVVVSADEGD